MTRLNHNALAILSMLWGGRRKVFRYGPPISGAALQAHVLRLERLGLVQRDHGLKGTLRASCRFIPAREMP